MDPNDFTQPPAAPAADRKPRRTPGCLFGFLGGCATSLFLAAVLPTVLMMSFISQCGTSMESLTSVTSLADTQKSPYRTLTEAKAKEAKTVLKLKLDGVIIGEATGGLNLLSGNTSDAALLKAINKATDDTTIDALIIEINSPGGGVTPSDLIYHALERFKAAKKDRKVIVYGGSVVASGAYYLAMQADWIRLQPTTIVGSIGVIIPGINYAGLAEKLGILDNSITSGASKDLGNPLKPINPEHNAILHTIIEATYNRFVAIVAKGRRMTEEKVRTLADGRVYSAQDAHNLGLIDDIGYSDTLNAKAAELLGCTPEALRILEPTIHPLSGFFAELPAALGRALTAPLTQPRAQGPEYRWTDSSH